VRRSPLDADGARDLERGLRLVAAGQVLEDRARALDRLQRRALPARGFARG
jgi:hypothetical protein